MSLEQALKENTEAMLALAAALKACGTATATPAKTAKETKPAKEAKASEHTREEMQAALTTLKEKTDGPTAKAIIKKHGGVEKMADIPDEKIDAVYAAAVEALPPEDDM